MKKKLFVKRIFSIVLAVALLVSAVPISLAVQDLFIEETTSKIVREVTELREESVKHFLCEDGSYIAATYSAPVHYKENGEWKEIDNSLSLDRSTLSESGKPTYTTKAGGLSVSIPQNFSDGQKITAQNKGYEIGFGINANQNDASLKTSASVVEIEALSSNTEVVMSDTVKRINNVTTASTLDSNDIEAYNAEIMTVDNQSSAVTYEEIMPDTDFEYIVTSNSIKENIVVYEPQYEYTYSFDMDFDGLTPVINPDNSISLIEPNNPDETIFFIEAPYMYDSNNEESIDIEMSLASNGDEYVMTLVASDKWINAPERVFPVVIDPTIQLLNSNINDVFVINGLYDDSPRVKKEIRVGRNLTNITRTYVKITLPTIPTASVITDANFTLTKDYFYREMFEDDIDIKVYDCRNVAEWTPDTVTWNNQPFGNSANSYRSKGAECLDYIFASGSKTKYVFDITSAVQRWYDTGINNGLMFASSDEVDKVQVDFHSSRVSDSANRPAMTFTYLPSGVNTSNVTFDAASGTSQPITITSSKEWLITTNQSWITTTPSSGTGTASFVINVSKNTSVEPRTGVVVITSGGSVIGSINVTQLGSAPNLILEKTNLTFTFEAGSKDVGVTSNTNWSFSIDNETESWINVEKNEQGTGLKISVERNAEEDSETTNGENETNNNVYEARFNSITVFTDKGEVDKKIYVTQLSELENYFNTINSDGTFNMISSSNYNHELATWAMELSYAAYNPVNYELIPGIPGGFMQGEFAEPTRTAKADLESLGFDATAYNYEDGYLDYAAYTIAHKEITIHENLQQNINVTNGDENYGDNHIGNSGVTGNSLCSDSNTNSINTSSYLYSPGTGLGDFDSNTLNYTVNENNSNNSRPVVVVAVRGSVTPLDWLMDLLTQFHICAFDFETGRDMVLKSLYGCDGNCVECIGTGSRCEGYLEKNNISNPIILVTGHSMGAAIANLVAAELNIIEGQEDVFAYTFATPTVKSNINGNATTPYSNIFNILNTNDVVTYVPTSLFLPGINLWSRYGIDIPLNMIYSDSWEAAPLGFFSHSMEVYMKWMWENKGITYDELLLKSDEAIARGLLPKLLQVNCPVGVSIKDSNDNIIAYESLEENIVYPDVTDTGIISWITNEGTKMFFIPSSANAVNIEIEAYDYGTMDFAIGTAGTTDETEIKAFNDVSLYPGKEFLVEVSEDTLPEDTQLFITENGEIVGEVTETVPHLKSVTVTHEIEPRQVVSYKTFVTDDTVSSIRFYDKTHGFNYYLYRDTGHGTVVEDGDNLIWTAGYIYSQAGDYLYDVYVESDGNWYTYTNAFSVHIPQEFIDIRTETLETNSINATTEITPVVII